MKEFLSQAQQVASTLPDPEAKEQLLKDLATIH
jgi:hypothetical protein